MPFLKTPAITLQSRKWGNADRIVTFYTERFGKVRGIACGARRMKSRFGSALEPFVHCDLNLFEKLHDSLYRVTQADIRESFSCLREDLRLMARAARLVNLVAALTADGDPEAQIFVILLGSLRSLRDGADPSVSVLLFQFRLLGQTGYRPQIEHCAACGQERDEARERVAFSPLAGGLICADCESHADPLLRLSPETIAFFRHALRWDPALLTRLKPTGLARTELERVVDAYVAAVIGKRLPPVDFLVAEPASAYGTGPG
jgi:DNA repair protein RecO (recombination protein O)